jgi:cytochrome d ubiquinol oxidase subunit I
LETSRFVIGGISSLSLINKRNEAFFGRSLKIVLAALVVIAPLQIFIGHLSAEQVYHYQPTKLAAMEAQWETVPAGQTADWSLLALPNEKTESNTWEVTVPNALGYLLELKPKLTEPVQGLKTWPSSDRPRMVGLIYYSFRIMIGIGMFFATLMAVTAIQWIRGKLADPYLSEQRWLLRSWIFAAPLGYIAVETGWIVRCVGRQPWTVYGEIRTVDAASNLPAGEILFSLSGLMAMYTVFFIATLYFGSRIIRNGPNLDLPLPKRGGEVEPAQHEPNRRPLEGPQPSN